MTTITYIKEHFHSKVLKRCSSIKDYHIISILRDAPWTMVSWLEEMHHDLQLELHASCWVVFCFKEEQKIMCKLRFVHSIPFHEPNYHNPIWLSIQTRPKFHPSIHRPRNLVTISQTDPKSVINRSCESGSGNRFEFPHGSGIENGTKNKSDRNRSRTRCYGHRKAKIQMDLEKESPYLKNT